MIRSFVLKIGTSSVFGLASLLWSISLPSAQAPPEQAHIILQMLDYVSVDYPEFVQDGIVLNSAEYDEQLEFTQQAREMLDQLPTHRDKPSLIRLAEQVISEVQSKRPGPEVAALAQQLRWAIINDYKVEVAPTRPPTLNTATVLYQVHCANCHGPEGYGDGPAAAALNPSPSNFHERHRMEQRSVYGLYSNITLGIQGTGMPDFQMLTHDERWALALYVSNLASPEADLQRGAKLWQSGTGQDWFPNLTSMVARSANDVRTAHGDEAVFVLAYLRLHPEAVMWSQESPLTRSARLLRQSLAAYRRGQVQAAQDLAASALLDGFGLVEATLDSVDRRLRMTIEAEMLGYRALLKEGEAVAAVATAVDRLQALLSEAQQQLLRTRLRASATFFSAFVILLREGVEAVLVLAAIFALLIKSKRQDALPYVHAGWIAALALGGITWIVAPYVVAIVTKGVTTLVAAAVLLYVGFWMHGMAYAERWRTLLHDHLQGALSARTMWALALVSFLPVYREAFETVLFYQALWVQVAPAYVPVLGGFVSASVTLTILGWLIFRGSIRLPLGFFFGATSLLLAVLAVVFVGRGVAALQEAGTLPVNPVNLPSIPVFGLYPTVQGLVLQVLVALVIASVFAYTRHRAQYSR
jgi:high-affinity iron transporter